MFAARSDLVSLPYETLRARTSQTVTCAARLTCLVSSPSHFGRSAGRFGRQALGEQKSPRSHRGAGFLLVAGVGFEPTTFRLRSEEHTSELQSLMRISYAVFCLKKK